MLRYFALGIIALAGGILIGAYLFSDTQPRSFLNIKDCQTSCLNQQEILGLLGSVGVQKFSGSIPFVVKETDNTIAISHPFPRSDIHYVIIPKKDIKFVEDITEEDADYITDAYAVMAALIREQNLKDYKIITNGPGFQTVEYLHFQLVSELPE